MICTPKVRHFWGAYQALCFIGYVFLQNTSFTNYGGVFSLFYYIFQAFMKARVSFCEFSAAMGIKVG